MKLEGKTALVTGAASGIGRATALAFAEAGCRLVVCDLDEAGLRSLEGETGGKVALSERVDVGDREAMQAFAGRVHERLGSAIDVLVNNAGIGMAGSLWETPLEAWDKVLRVNLYGVLHGCHFFVPEMVRRGQGGHVVNVSSALGFFGAGGVNAYVTSKFGVYGMSESLRAELHPHRIGVSTICPGVIHTNIVQDAPVYGAEDEAAAQERIRQAFRARAFPPAKVARAIVRGVRRNVAVVTVAPESTSLYWLKRLSPGLAAWVGRTMENRMGLSPH
ncbi:MAG: SDR family NAD(P)-dependent oxidoreductase [Planctomycetota bacterium]